MKLKSTQVQPTNKTKTDAKPVLADVHFAVTQYGFEYGNAKIERLMSDERRGWVIVQLKTDKADIQIYITRTGKVRVLSCGGKEWFEAK